MKKHFNAKTIVKAALFLFLLTSSVTFTVAFVHLQTNDRIQAQSLQAEQAAMRRVIEAETYEAVYTDGNGNDQLFRAVSESGETVGYLVRTSAMGYGGRVEILTGIVAGEVQGVEILDASAETPGLGQNILQEGFRNAFRGISQAPILTRSVANHANAEVQALTGATVSAQAVVNAVSAAMQLYSAVQGSSS